MVKNCICRVHSLKKPQTLETWWFNFHNILFSSFLASFVDAACFFMVLMAKMKSTKFHHTEDEKFHVDLS